MALVDLVALLVLLQYFVFSFLVAKARGTYGVAAPAVAGHEMFVRAYRVQMNTLELLVVLLPALYIAARYWSTTYCAAAGLVFFIGRIIYRQSYMRDPKSRSIGFALSALPMLALVAAGFIGAIGAIR